MTASTERQARAAEARKHQYELFMLTLCIYTLGVFSVTSFMHVDPRTRDLLEWSDTAVCALFLLDFLLHLYRAPNRTHYMLTWGWIDAISSVPVVNVLRVGRLARILRVIRVLRGVRATKLIASFVLERRAHGTALAAALVSLLLLFFSAAAMLQFETTPEGNIKTAADALWWALATITTVGYGDRYPVTHEGRMIAGLLMTAGVGLFGITSGFVAAWFIAPSQKHQEGEVELLRRDIQDLRHLIEAKGESNRGEGRP